MREALTMKEVCDRLGVGTSTVYRLMDADPDFRTFKIAGKRLMRKQVLDAYIEKQEQRELESRGLA